MRPWKSGRQRAIALVSVLLATTLILALIVVMLDVGMSGLRRSTERMRSLQAQAGADAGTSYVRAVLADKKGDLSALLLTLAKTQNRAVFDIEDHTQVRVDVSVQLAVPAVENDHVDYALQRHAQVAETPLQVTSKATVLVDGSIVASRTQIALLRAFHSAVPYSEIVGVIDAGGPVGIDSPGDAAGQSGGAYATDLRIHAYTQAAGALIPADDFAEERWFDGNVQRGGQLP